MDKRISEERLKDMEYAGLLRFIPADLEDCNCHDLPKLRARVGELTNAITDLVEDIEWYSEDMYDREAPHQLESYKEAKQLLKESEK